MKRFSKVAICVLLAGIIIFFSKASFAVSLTTPTKLLITGLDDATLQNFSDAMKILAVEPDVLSEWDKFNEGYWFSQKNEKFHSWMLREQNKFASATELINKIGVYIENHFKSSPEIEIGKELRQSSARLVALWKENTSCLDRINRIPKGMFGSTAKAKLAFQYRDTGLRSKLKSEIAKLAEFFKILKVMKEFVDCHEINSSK
ncbi:MAG: hypothetical protein HQM10_08075 [Candidatus Riflebacteria bacterium]|nr:hypothetical protein [Candidatus Riflebacteria bacterium]